MALESATDLSGFFSTDEHAKSVTFTPSGGSASTIKGIFENAFELVEVGGIGVEATIPTLTVKSTDVSGLVHGDAFVIDSVSYLARIVRPDGTGVTEVQLEEQ